MPKGVVVVNTGNGKGKTTAALGMALRAAGHGMRVLVVQFVKSNIDTGEVRALQQLDGITVKTLGAGFLKNDDEDIEKHKESAANALEYSKGELSSGRHDMVVLDEILFAMKKGLIEEADVDGLLDSRPDDVHIVLTGRGCPQPLIDRADIVTEMLEVKHIFSEGVGGQRGVEF
jgi:cob(I)alamin adenosyltransferase